MILEQRQQLIGNGCNQNLIRDAETALATEDADVVVLPVKLISSLREWYPSAPITDHRVMVPVSRSVAMIRDSLLRMQMNYEHTHCRRRFSCAVICLAIQLKPSRIACRGNRQTVLS